MAYQTGYIRPRDIHQASPSASPPASQPASQSASPPPDPPASQPASPPASQPTRLVIKSPAPQHPPQQPQWLSFSSPSPSSPSSPIGDIPYEMPQVAPAVPSHPYRVSSFTTIRREYSPSSPLFVPY